MKKNKKSGFTLIELLAVIVILGILMIIAVPSVIKYIRGSNKDAYVNSIKSIVVGARNLIHNGKEKFTNSNTTYYISGECINTENDYRSPYGEFVKVYVVVVFNGSGYDYYWIGVDETGRGIKELVNFDKITEDSIEENIEDTDILTDVGIDGRENIVMVEKDSCTKSSPVEANSQSYINSNEISTNPKCRRVEDISQLHTEVCNSDGYCAQDGYSGSNNTIRYGNIWDGISSLKTGDAFDCDLNGNGVYDERFYYVSDYYNTRTRQFDSSTAVLIYYTNTVNGVKSMYGSAYSTIEDAQALGLNITGDAPNYLGPITAVKSLPTTTSWSNMKLKTSLRTILGCNRNDACATIYDNIGGNVLPTSFDYSGKAGRLLTLKEVRTGCISDPSTPYNLAGSLTAKCNFLLEGTKYANLSNPTYGFWLETPEYGSKYVFDTSCVSRITGDYYPYTPENAVRPAIEVSKRDLS